MEEYAPTWMVGRGPVRAGPGHAEQIRDDARADACRSSGLVEAWRGSSLAEGT